MVPRGDNGQFLCEVQAFSDDAPDRGEIKIQAVSILASFKYCLMLTYFHRLINY